MRCNPWFCICKTFERLLYVYVLVGLSVCLSESSNLENIDIRVKEFIGYTKTRKVFKSKFAQSSDKISRPLMP